MDPMLQKWPLWRCRLIVHFKVARPVLLPEVFCILNRMDPYRISVPLPRTRRMAVAQRQPETGTSLGLRFSSLHHVDRQMRDGF
ncbi:hypothetical protein CERSUDRAFT_118414 [Gelatoporia subvermispora B]|uniref:Uncharacterized protein n=1 Tax=Ceriporiopsis subvermispora (strain B) TaxID=914234 RepID=M2R283_CERS8|nr:hypothetical protein CERSUDRAFT_118414 [Gelatoporia subvermispora B]